MRIGAYLVAAACLASASGAAAASKTLWRHGYLTCPDGSIERPTFFPHAPPTAQDLDNACALRAENKRMRNLPILNRPPPTTSPEELRRQAANLIGPSR